jgi:hypothetical protein
MVQLMICISLLVLLIAIGQDSYRFSGLSLTVLHANEPVYGANGHFAVCQITCKVLCRQPMFFPV